ncbi:FxSxx-COOH system tetratricopeptide repeat protein [Actinomadura sp. 21ATH]|uniref:FxSxx-COOH system tetratricopeptide repeat protein n=1 Tax=Actinomadura sp. 21ATH TaxID=1735444 RepID=UPI0035C05E2A
MKRDLRGTGAIAAGPEPRVEASGTGAIAADGDVINSSTHVGDVYQGVPLPRADEVDPPPWAPPTLPARTRSFVGRGGKLAELDAALAAPGGAVVQAVHGLGGVGKSTLVAHWAHRHAAAHTLTWWIIADSVESITAGLAELAAMLLPEITRSVPAEVALEERAAWARRWLATHTGWLVVLDNVTHPADVAELVTGAPGGRFLITSRLREGWHDLAPAVIELDVLSPDEAQEMLAGAVTAGRAGADLTGAAELCQELGYLPLAVTQAGAFIRQTHLSPDGYLELLRADPAAMYDQTGRGADGERTIARIWRITLNHLVQTTPLTGDALRVLAWWAPQDIPRNLLAPLAGPAQLATALGDLAAYSMITLSPDTITVHRLVQAVARTPDYRPADQDGDPHRRPADIHTARETATDLLNQTRPATSDNPATWPAWRTLLPHIHALAEHASPDTDIAVTSLLLDRTAAFLRDQGAVDRAIGYFERALICDERLLGDEHPTTLAARNNLAGAYQAAGNLGRAIPLYEAAQADYERVLGGDHPDTLQSRNNLAGAYEALGDLGRAVPLFEATLTDYERVLGGDHPATLTSRNDLAGAYESAGDLGRAIPLYEATLTDYERVLGSDHPHTLTSRNNLAYAYRAAGDLDRAIPLYEATLTDYERVLGGDHPATLTSRNNLAGAYRVAGDLGRAVPLYEATLTDRERVLGSDHPHTLQSRNNLASAYESAGDLGWAVPLYEQTLADRERVLGSDHPHTLTSRNNLAHAYRSAGDLGRAVPLYEATLSDCERVLSPGHPLTESVRANLEAARG